MEFDVAQNEDIIRQFQSWAIMARPRSPHVWQVVEDMLTSTRDIMDRNHLTEVTQLTLAMLPDVVEFSGPRRLTSGIWRSIELLGMPGANVSDRPHDILAPRLYGDVLVMPAHSFAFSMIESAPHKEVWESVKQDAQGPPLVTHHYSGSWKNDKGGE
jgi:alpha 1,6-mannosyltransferase